MSARWCLFTNQKQNKKPRVPPLTDVIFDLQLLYIPGLDDEEEEEDTSGSGGIVPVSTSDEKLEEDESPALSSSTLSADDE